MTPFSHGISLRWGVSALFVATLATYILLAGGNRLHILPQFALITLLSIHTAKKGIRNFRRPEISGVLVGGLMCVAFMVAAEASSETPAIGHIIKFLANTLTLFLVISLGSLLGQFNWYRAFFVLSLFFFIVLGTIQLKSQGVVGVSQSIVLFLSGTMNSIDQLRATGEIHETFGHKNLLATFIATTFACFLIFRATEHRRIGLLDFAITGLFVATVLLTFSRSGLLMAVGAVFGFQFLSLRSYAIRLIWLAIGLFVGTVALITLIDFDPTDGMYTRLYLWQEAGWSLRENLFIGSGELLEGGVEIKTASIQFEAHNYHNFLLNQAASYGVGFVIGYQLMMISFLSALFRHSRHWVALPVIVFIMNNSFQNWGIEYQSFLPFIALAMFGPHFPAAANTRRQFHFSRVDGRARQGVFNDTEPSGGAPCSGSG